MRRCVAAVSLVAFLTANPAQAQQPTILGLVSTRDGRVVAGASVTVRCGPAATQRITDSFGAFVFDVPGVGVCEVTVVTPWFDTSIRTLDLGSSRGGPVQIVVPSDRSASRRTQSDARLAVSVWQASASQSASLASSLRLSDRWIAQGTFLPYSGQSQAGLGEQWATKSILRGQFRGGIEVGASVIARRGYDRSLAMAESLGSDTVGLSGPTYYLDTSRAPVLWDTELRVKKRLKSNGSLQIDFVGEAFNVLNRHGSTPTDSPGSSATFHARTLRLGIVLSWDSQQPSAKENPSPAK